MVRRAPLPVAAAVLGVAVDGVAPGMGWALLGGGIGGGGRPHAPCRAVGPSWAPVRGGVSVESARSV